MNSYKKFIIALGVLVIIAVGVYALASLFVRPANTDSFITEPTTVTLEGKLVCLPKPGDGPHTLECSIGLQADHGDHYSLTNLPDTTPDVGEDVRVTGELRESDSDVYDTVGSLSVQSISNR